MLMLEVIAKVNYYTYKILNHNLIVQKLLWLFFLQIILIMCIDLSWFWVEHVLT